MPGGGSENSWIGERARKRGEIKGGEVLTQSVLLLQHVCAGELCMMTYAYDISGEFHNVHYSITNNHGFLSVARSNIANVGISSHISP